MKFFHFFLFALAFLMPPSMDAQSIDSIHSLSFLTGTWKTQHPWGDMTEIWSDTDGGNLMCTFRCISEGKVVFYEWIVIESTPEGPVMKLRHFNPGSIAWEEKDHPHTYRLIDKADNKCVFESEDKETRISYARVSPSVLICHLEHTDKEGNPVKDTFTYTLKQ